MLKHAHGCLPGIQLTSRHQAFAFLHAWLLLQARDHVHARAQVGNDAAKHSNSGGFFFRKILENTRMWFEEFEQDGLRVSKIDGRLVEVNTVLQSLHYDANDVYQGYVPFVVSALDNYNYGECSGEHECGAQEPCVNHRLAESHNDVKMGILNAVVDVTVGAPAKCNFNTCEKCNAQEGCGWCPTACLEFGGKCMMATEDRRKPRFETCEMGIVKGQLMGWRQCVSLVEDLGLIIGAVVGPTMFLLLVLLYIWLRWVQRRHGSVGIYFRKKQSDAARYMRKINVMPPDEASYFQIMALTAFVVVTIAVVAIFSMMGGEPTCVFDQQFFLDKANTVTLRLDNCYVRFLPAQTQSPPDDQLEAVKIKFALKKDPKIKLEGSWCGRDVNFTVVNSLPDSIKYIGYYCSVEILVPDK
jgi:hypothetical protein